jgi:hypothetical protein
MSTSRIRIWKEDEKGRVGGREGRSRENGNGCGQEEEA